MTTVHFTLRSNRGDRLGHLIRGVQMLRSHGSEADVTRCTDVFHLYSGAGEPASLSCVLEATSSATPEELVAMCRETEWALGDDPDVLTVQFERYDQTAPELPHPAHAARTPVDGSVLFLHRAEFAHLFDWGQQSLDGDGVMGEWPDATGQGE